MNSKYLRIGLIVRPHGIHGAVKVQPATDDSSRFRLLSHVYIENNGGYEQVDITDVSVRPDAITLHLEGIDTPEAAEKLRGRYLLVDRAHAVPLPPDSYFVADLVGCEVLDTDGMSYGHITDVLETGANDVYEVNGGKLMVPALKRVLHKVDTEGGRIILDAAVLREVGLFED